MSQVMAEIGISGPVSFSDSRVRKMMMNPRSGYYGSDYLVNTASLGDARATRYYSANRQNIWLASEFTHAGGIFYKLIIDNGAQVGATAGNSALTIGQFPAGSNIVIVNYGNILGCSGGIGQGSTGGPGLEGGTALYAADWGNQYTHVYNKSTGLIYGGGGGGGKGGTGGTGGRGGAGYYVATGQEGPFRNGTETGVYRFINGVTYWKWFAAGLPQENFFSGAGDGTDIVGHNGSTYYRHVASGGQEFSPGAGLYQAYEIYRRWNYNVGTEGGWGGAGGLGGDGGRGWGWDYQSNGPTNGGLNAGRAGGTQGGANAGWGGWGGTGGAGGWGGGWGAAGAAGNNGNPGETGGAGNNGGGQGGSWGTGGFSGGQPGYHVRLNGRGGLANEGGVLGRSG